jgi:hypothetical protein
MGLLTGTLYSQRIPRSVEAMALPEAGRALPTRDPFGGSHHDVVGSQLPWCPVVRFVVRISAWDSSSLRPPDWPASDRPQGAPHGLTTNPSARA